MKSTRLISLLLALALLASLLIPAVADEPDAEGLVPWKEATPTDLQPEEEDQTAQEESSEEEPVLPEELQPQQEVPQQDAPTQPETQSQQEPPQTDEGTEEPAETQQENLANAQQGPVSGQPEEAEEPFLPVHFTEGYVLIRKHTKAYADEAGQEPLGTFPEDAVVCAFSFRQAENPARDVLKIVFDTQSLREINGPLQTGYLLAALAEPLTEEQSKQQEADLDRDPKTRIYSNSKIPVVAFTFQETEPKEGEAAVNSIRENAPDFTAKAPSSVKAGIGKKVKITVKVSKNAKKTAAYQWQESTDGGQTWQDCAYKGFNKKTLTVPVTEQRFRSLFRCLVTFSGQSLYTNTVAFRSPYTIKVTPANRELKKGRTGKFRVKVKGAKGKIRYRWQYSKDGGLTWKAAKVKGRKTKTITVKASDSTYGTLYRCVVSAKKGKAISPSVRIDQPGTADFTFELQGDTWKIARYTGAKSSLTIPEKYGGKKVTAIGDGAFRGNTTLKTLKVPKTITTIGANAFDGCTALTTVTLTNNVISIGRAAFQNCACLANLKIGE